MSSSILTYRSLAARLRLPESRRSGAFLVVGTLAIGAYFLLPPDAQSIAFVLFGLASAVAIVVGAQRAPADARLPWYRFAAGILCQAAGDTIFAVYEIRLDREPPVPSVADVFYLCGYPLFAVGVYLLLRRLGTRSRGALLDTLIVASAVAVVEWIFFVDPYAHEQLGWDERLVHMAYPAVDTFLVVALLQLLVGPVARSTSYRLLLAAIGLWTVADQIYSLSSDRYAAGGWLDAVWLGAYVAWGAAALDPSIASFAQRERRSSPRLSPSRLLLLGAALLTAPTIAAIELAAHHNVHVLVPAIGAAIIAVLVLARFADLVASVDRSRRAERDAREEVERAQTLLLEQNERLREVDRLKDEFVSGVSHELRTPLTSITGYVELLLEDIETPLHRKQLEIVDRNAERLLALVDDLLFAARLQDHRLELERLPLDLRALVEESVAAARPRAEAADVQVSVAAGGEAPIKGERVRLGQVLDNLISNAIKFTPGGGRVDVSIAPRDGTVCLEVTDTGIGIPEEERARLFERFYRSQSALERQIQGTGLGLYVSKAIVEAHGGRIAVRSGEGQGTTFIVELPAVS
jgi:signal transduction histidine kinase